MIITETLCEEFANFLLTVPAARLKQYVVKLLLTHLKYEYPDKLPEYLPGDLIAFFNLLDIIDKEMDQSGII
jgi:hypothetical protein